MAFGCYITYRGLDATQKIQTVFIIFQLVVLAIFAIVALYKASLEGVSLIYPQPLNGLTRLELNLSQLFHPVFLLCSLFTGAGTRCSP